MSTTNGLSGLHATTPTDSAEQTTRVFNIQDGIHNISNEIVKNENSERLEGKGDGPNDSSNASKLDEKSLQDEDEYLDILGNGQLKKKVLVKGKGKDTRPIQGDIVTLAIEGHLNDGTAVDKYSSLSFALGEGDVLQAWDLVVCLMEEGETIEVITDAKYAYGELGREPDVPPNSQITYTMELLKHEDKPDLSMVSVEEKLTMGEQKRERGNYLFSRQDFTGAINSYTKAIKILDYPQSHANTDPAKLQEILESKIKCCNNMAACQLKVEAYDAVIRSCQMVISSQPENVKAIFRMGKAHAAKGDTNDAIKYFKKALKLEPESKIIHQELSRLTRKLKSETESEKEMYRRMLGTNDWKNSTSNKKNSSRWTKWTLLVGALAVAGVSILAAYRFGNH